MPVSKWIVLLRQRYTNNRPIDERRIQLVMRLGETLLSVLLGVHAAEKCRILQSIEPWQGQLEWNGLCSHSTLKEGCRGFAAPVDDNELKPASSPAKSKLRPASSPVQNELRPVPDPRSRGQSPACRLGRGKVGGETTTHGSISGSKRRQNSSGPAAVESKT